MRKRFVRHIRFYLPFFYKYVFDMLYVDVFSKRYSYLGSYAEVNFDKQLASWISLFVLLIGMAIIREDFLKSFIRVMLYFSIIPSLSLYGLKNDNSIAFSLILAYWLLMIGSILVIQKIRRSKNTVNTSFFLPYGNEKYVWFAFLWSVCTTICFSGIYSGFRIFISFNDVYLYRNLVEVNSIVKYLLAWNTKIILPIILYVFFLNKHYIRFTICVFLMLLSYALFGNKSMFFTVFLVLGVILISKLRFTELTDILVGIFLLLYQIACLFFPSGTLTGLAYRFLVVPSEAHYYYYDFFQTHELLYLRQSVLRHFFDSPYDMPVYVILGQIPKYYPASDGISANNANNGLFSDAFQNFGAIGVLLYPMIIAFTLFVLFRAMEECDYGVQYIILLLSSIFLLSSSYFSWLLSGGVLILLLILKSIRKKRERTKCKQKPCPQYS